MKKNAQMPDVSGQQPVRSGYERFKHIVGIIVTWCYRLRKVVLAAPVVYFALRLAAYNTVNLPLSVALLLPSSGDFSFHVSRYTAVVAPLGLTGACLAMMFLSKKALYAWAISVFTLAVPVLLVLSNNYPA